MPGEAGPAACNPDSTTPSCHDAVHRHLDETSLKMSICSWVRGFLNAGSHTAVSHAADIEHRCIIQCYNHIISNCWHSRGEPPLHLSWNTERVADQLLFLNIGRMRKVVGYGRKEDTFWPLTSDHWWHNWSTVQKFLGVYIRENLCWTSCVTALSKKAKQCFHCLHLLKEMHLLSLVSILFYTDTIDKVLHQFWKLTRRWL